MLIIKQPKVHIRNVNFSQETTYVENTDSQRLSVNNTTPGSDIREENSDEHDDVQPLAKKMKLNTEEDSELDGKKIV